MNSFVELVAEKIENYVLLRRALGHTFKTQADILKAFLSFLEQNGNEGPLTQELVLSFVLSCKVTPNTRARRYGFLRNFAAYFSVFDSRTESLELRVLPRSRAIAPVRILDEKELSRLLQAARDCSPRHPICGQTLYTLIGLIASTGLRSGEALRLDRSDVDLDRGVLQIRQSKFSKDRLVPVHPTTREALRLYSQSRDAAYPRSNSPAFFLNFRAGRLCKSGFEAGFRQARTRTGLHVGVPRGVRPHDLRHRFVVTRLVAWHREGVDVQARLPALATYLGHARYSDTAYYVTGTPELLAIAAARAFSSEGGCS